MSEAILSTPIPALHRQWPWVEDFFSAHGIAQALHQDLTIAQLAETLGDDFFADLGSSRGQLAKDFALFIQNMLAFQEEHGSAQQILSLTVLPGHDKAGQAEPCTLELKPGEISALVGPTGAGKSRLLGDIECLAQEDSPTGRKVLINGREPSESLRFSTEERLIAQLSQNMNFVMDLSVEDFLTMHAESRMAEHIANTVSLIYGKANELAGESFSRSTPITQLSGGQSRALMIADTALLSHAPIVLIDEIENAGVDKASALELLVSRNKIVLISTHDPVLALSAHQRIVIRNGGVQQILRTTGEEKAYLGDLKAMDALLSEIRRRLRSGETLGPPHPDAFH